MGGGGGGVIFTRTLSTFTVNFQCSFDEGGSNFAAVWMMESEKFCSLVVGGENYPNPSLEVSKEICCLRCKFSWKYCK